MSRRQRREHFFLYVSFTFPVNVSHHSLGIESVLYATRLASWCDVSLGEGCTRTCLITSHLTFTSKKKLRSSPLSVEWNMFIFRFHFFFFFSVLLCMFTATPRCCVELKWISQHIFYLCLSFFLWLFIRTAPVFSMPLIILSIVACCKPPNGCDGGGFCWAPPSSSMEPFWASPSVIAMLLVCLSELKWEKEEWRIVRKRVGILCIVWILNGKEICVRKHKPECARAANEFQC